MYSMFDNVYQYGKGCVWGAAFVYKIDCVCLCTAQWVHSSLLAFTSILAPPLTCVWTKSINLVLLLSLLSHFCVLSDDIEHII